MADEPADKANETKPNATADDNAAAVARQQQATAAAKEKANASRAAKPKAAARPKAAAKPKAAVARDADGRPLTSNPEANPEGDTRSDERKLADALHVLVMSEGGAGIPVARAAGAMKVDEEKIVAACEESDTLDCDGGMVSLIRR